MARALTLTPCLVARFSPQPAARVPMRRVLTKLSRVLTVMPDSWWDLETGTLDTARQLPLNPNALRRSLSALGLEASQPENKGGLHLRVAR